jgi:hypothetical protein
MQRDGSAVADAASLRSPAYTPCGWLPLVLLPSTAVVFRNVISPWEFMVALSFAIFFALKWATWWTSRSCVPHSAWRSVAYLFAWPGMDADAFLDEKQKAPAQKPSTWLWAMTKTVLGAALLWGVARAVPPEHLLLRGWVGMVGLILLLHFGTFELIALFWQRLGIRAEPIMHSPLRSASLAEFWGKRWNLGFRELAHEFVFRPLYKPLGPKAASLMVFLCSGLVHEAVISLPAGAGYGLPTLYFLIQGVGVTAERSQFGRALGLMHGIGGRCFMFVFLVTPVFWLFHPPFVLKVILPLMRAIRAL